MSANEAKIVDSSKLACYINNTNTIGKYILDNSDCSSLSDTSIATIPDTKVIIDYLPTIIISVSVLIVITVALAVFIYYRYCGASSEQRDPLSLNNLCPGPVSRGLLHQCVNTVRTRCQY